MSKTSILKDELIERLINIDEEISLIYKGTIDFVIVGGSALILNFGSSRGTPDIDVLNINKDIESIVEKYDMNARSGIFETKCLPAGILLTKWQSFFPAGRLAGKKAFY